MRRIAAAPVTPQPLDESAQKLLEMIQPWHVVGRVPEQLCILCRAQEEKILNLLQVIYIYLHGYIYLIFILLDEQACFMFSQFNPCVALLCFTYKDESAQFTQLIMSLFWGISLH